MAINTGPVVVGTIGDSLRTDYTATGNTTSIASRLLHVAEAGQIVLTNRTRQLAGVDYAFGRLGEMSLTESLESVEVYALIREAVEHIESRYLAAV